MATIETGGAYRWPTHRVSMPIEIGDVLGTTRDVGLSGVVFRSPASYVVGTAISFVISMKSETVPVRLACRGVVTKERAVGKEEYETAATIDTIRITPL